MCYGCWEEYNKPSIINERTKKAALLIKQVYDHSLSGGNLHIIVDDFNIEDHHIAFCALYILKNGEENAIKLQAEVECLDAFLEMSVEERASALAIYEEWIE